MVKYKIPTSENRNKVERHIRYFEQNCHFSLGSDCPSLLCTTRPTSAKWSYHNQPNERCLLNKCRTIDCNTAETQYCVTQLRHRAVWHSWDTVRCDTVETLYSLTLLRHCTVWLSWQCNWSNNIVPCNTTEMQLYCLIHLSHSHNTK